MTLHPQSHSIVSFGVSSTRLFPGIDHEMDQISQCTWRIGQLSVFADSTSIISTLVGNSNFGVLHSCMTTRSWGFIDLDMSPNWIETLSSSTYIRVESHQPHSLKVYCHYIPWQRLAYRSANTSHPYRNVQIPTAQRAMNYTISNLLALGHSSKLILIKSPCIWGCAAGEMNPTLHASSGRRTPYGWTQLYLILLCQATTTTYHEVLSNPLVLWHNDIWEHRHAFYPRVATSQTTSLSLIKISW